jgi:hypothetical protein
VLLWHGDCCCCVVLWQGDCCCCVVLWRGDSCCGVELWGRGMRPGGSSPGGYSSSQSPPNLIIKQYKLITRMCLGTPAIGSLTQITRRIHARPKQRKVSHHVWLTRSSKHRDANPTAHALTQFYIRHAY